MQHVFLLDDGGGPQTFLLIIVLMSGCVCLRDGFAATVIQPRVGALELGQLPLRYGLLGGFKNNVHKLVRDCVDIPNEDLVPLYLFEMSP